MTAAPAPQLTVRLLPPQPLGAHPCGAHPCVSVSDRVQHGAVDASGSALLCRAPATVQQPGLSNAPAGAAICGKCRTAASRLTGVGGPTPQ